MHDVSFELGREVALTSPLVSTQATGDVDVGLNFCNEIAATGATTPSGNPVYAGKTKQDTVHIRAQFTPEPDTNPDDDDQPISEFRYKLEAPNGTPDQADLVFAVNPTNSDPIVVRSGKLTLIYEQEGKPQQVAGFSDPADFTAPGVKPPPPAPDDDDTSIAGATPQPSIPDESPPPDRSPAPVAPDRSAFIREWIAVAQPPINAIQGAQTHYNNRGNMVGQTPTGIIVDRHNTGQFDPNFLWNNRSLLDSVDHCTMREYVDARMTNASIQHCIGRYRRAPTTRTPTTIEDRIAQAGRPSGSTNNSGNRVFVDDFRGTSPSATGADTIQPGRTATPGSVATTDQAAQARDRRDRDRTAEAGRRTAASDARQAADDRDAQTRDQDATASADQADAIADRVASAQAAGAAAVAAEAARPPPGISATVFYRPSR